MIQRNPTAWAAVALAVGACVLPDLSLEGRPCPCGEGYVCDAATNTCVAGGGSTTTATSSGSGPTGTGTSSSSGLGGAGGMGGEGGGPPTSAYATAVLADGPIAYYRLGEDPTSALAFDTVGDFDGAYTLGAMRGVPGAIANDPDTAVELDGISGSVALPDAFDFEGNVPYTIELWCRPTSTATTRFLFDKTGEVGIIRDGYSVLLYSDETAGMERWSNDVATASNSTPLTLGAWHHVVATFDGLRVRIYLNGAAGTSPGADSGPLIGSASQAQIGVSWTGASLYTGGVDEVAVYDYVLPTDRILEHFQIGLGL